MIFKETKNYKKNLGISEKKEEKIGILKAIVIILNKNTKCFLNW
tara:strand:+ start:457 stop:588 length:132 start_codon:yes stop_codon:yes gene_type:complete